MKKILICVIPAVLAVGTIVLLLGPPHWTGNRVEDYSTAVDRYDAYSQAYAAPTERKVDQPIMWTCYGGKWDRYSSQLLRDIEARKGDVAYLKERAAHFRKLKEKYEAARADPEAKITIDPPLDQ